MRFLPMMSLMAVFPALIQSSVTTESGSSRPIETEAREFMEGYAEDLRSGRRQALVDRYDMRGAYRVGEGEKGFETLDKIRVAYFDQWQPPATFEWRDLSFETIGADEVFVVGLYDWGSGDGRQATYSYTALLNRRNGVLKIRLEHESADRLPKS
jgi:hypothetical protein